MDIQSGNNGSNIGERGSVSFLLDEHHHNDGEHARVAGLEQQREVVRIGPARGLGSNRFNHTASSPDLLRHTFNHEREVTFIGEDPDYRGYRQFDGDMRNNAIISAIATTALHITSRNQQQMNPLPQIAFSQASAASRLDEMFYLYRAIFAERDNPHTPIVVERHEALQLKFVLCSLLSILQSLRIFEHNSTHITSLTIDEYGQQYETEEAFNRRHAANTCRTLINNTLLSFFPGLSPIRGPSWDRSKFAEYFNDYGKSNDEDRLHCDHFFLVYSDRASVVRGMIVSTDGAGERPFSATYIENNLRIHKTCITLEDLWVVIQKQVNTFNIAWFSCDTRAVPGENYTKDASVENLEGASDSGMSNQSEEANDGSDIDEFVMLREFGEIVYHGMPPDVTSKEYWVDDKLGNALSYLFHTCVEICEVNLDSARVPDNQHDTPFDPTPCAKQKEALRKDLFKSQSVGSAYAFTKFFATHGKKAETSEVEISYSEVTFFQVVSMLSLLCQDIQRVCLGISEKSDYKPLSTSNFHTICLDSLKKKIANEEGRFHVSQQLPLLMEQLETIKRQAFPAVPLAHIYPSERRGVDPQYQMKLHVLKTLIESERGLYILTYQNGSEATKGIVLRKQTHGLTQEIVVTFFPSVDEVQEEKHSDPDAFIDWLYFSFGINLSITGFTVYEKTDYSALSLNSFSVAYDYAGSMMRSLFVLPFEKLYALFTPPPPTRKERHAYLEHLQDTVSISEAKHTEEEVYVANILDRDYDTDDEAPRERDSSLPFPEHIQDALFSIHTNNGGNETKFAEAFALSHAKAFTLAPLNHPRAIFNPDGSNRFLNFAAQVFKMTPDQLAVKLGAICNRTPRFGVVTALARQMSHNLNFDPIEINPHDTAEFEELFQIYRMLQTTLDYDNNCHEVIFWMRFFDWKRLELSQEISQAARMGSEVASPFYDDALSAIPLKMKEIESEVRGKISPDCELLSDQLSWENVSIAIDEMKAGDVMVLQYVETHRFIGREHARALLERPISEAEKRSNSPTKEFPEGTKFKRPRKEYQILIYKDLDGKLGFYEPEYLGHLRSSQTVLVSSAIPRWLQSMFEHVSDLAPDYILITRADPAHVKRKRAIREVVNKTVEQALDGFGQDYEVKSIHSEDEET